MRENNENEPLQWHTIFNEKEIDTMISMKMFSILKGYYMMLCEVEYMPPVVFLGFIGEYVYADYYNKILSDLGEEVIEYSEENFFLSIPEELQEILDLKLLGRNAFQIASYYFLKEFTDGGLVGEFGMERHLGSDNMG